MYLHTTATHQNVHWYLQLLDGRTFFSSVLGDPRTNQNPGVLAMAVIFYRWHNYQAMLVKKNRPDWVDEDIFQAARRRVIASIQVTFVKFLASYRFLRTALAAQNRSELLLVKSGALRRNIAPLIILADLPFSMPGQCQMEMYHHEDNFQPKSPKLERSMKVDKVTRTPTTDSS